MRKKLIASLKTVDFCCRFALVVAVVAVVVVVVAVVVAVAVAVAVAVVVVFCFSKAGYLTRPGQRPGEFSPKISQNA